jgi:hypothetical protein
MKKFISKLIRNKNSFSSKLTSLTLTTEFLKDFWDLLNEKYDFYQSLYNGLALIKDYNYEIENFRCINYLTI